MPRSGIWRGGKRLYDAIEAGSLDPAESALGERIAGLTALWDQARTGATRIEHHACEFHP